MQQRVQLIGPLWQLMMPCASLKKAIRALLTWRRGRYRQWPARRHDATGHAAWHSPVPAQSGPASGRISKPETAAATATAIAAGKQRQGPLKPFDIDVFLAPVEVHWVHMAHGLLKNAT